MPATTQRREPRAIVIGGGVAGIALAVNLKKKLGYHNFTIYEREAGIGGTWYLNTYPGVGCDVDSHLYSYSFNLNPNWSQSFAEQKEILQYLEDTADKFDVRSHVRTRIEVVEAKWIEERSLWAVKLRDLTSNHVFTQEAEILVSCVGSISNPKDCTIPGIEKFKGEIWHSARWNHQYNIEGKRVAVVGNGCSAAQIVPRIADTVGKVVQFQRSPQWINDRPNGEFSELTKWAFRWVPGLNRLYRFYIWKNTDALHFLYLGDNKASEDGRTRATEVARQYMKRTAPAKYHDMLIPNYPLGCKRRIFDPGYLASLHNDNVELTTEPITAFTENGLQTNKRELEFDAVVLSTGFKIQEFLSPIEVVGRNNVTLNQHWKDTGGAQAYKGTFVSGFPNFGIVFGPNAFPAHNSVIYTHECQVEFIVKAVFRPILQNDFKIIEIKEAAENHDAQHTQQKLTSMVWNGGCTNWNLNETGRNTTNYHDYTWKYWWQLYWPVWNDFDLMGGRGTVPAHPGLKAAIEVSALVACTGVGLAMAQRQFDLPAFFQRLSSRI